MSDCTHVAAPCPPPRAGRPTPAPPRPTPGCWPRPWRWAGGCRCPASWASSRPPAGPASPPPSQPASTPPSSSQVHNQLLMILQNLSNMFPNPDLIHIEASTINYSISKSSVTLLDCVLRVELLRAVLDAITMCSRGAAPCSPNICPEQHENCALQPGVRVSAV